MPETIIEKQFLEYMDSFLGKNESDNYHYILKKDHSLLVRDHCRKICIEENFKKEFSEIASITALIHDIGRFEQFKQFHTFKDSDSIDHGCLGAKIIDDIDILQPLSPETKSAIKYTVTQHNQMTWKEKGPIEDMLNKVVRDSDKLDIYRVILEHLDGDKQTEQILLHLPDTEDYSKEILEDIYEGRVISYKKRKTFNDMKLTILNWIQDLNFKYSYCHIIEMNYINLICDTLPENNDMKQIRKFFLKYAKDASENSQN